MSNIKVINDNSQQSNNFSNPFEKHNDKQFVHLHNHSEFSILDGLSKTEDMAKKAVEIGSPAIALTDHGRMAGILEFYQNCLKHGIKPILGMEAYTTPYGKNRSERVGYDVKELRGKPGYVRNNYHLILLAKDYEGYKNLCALSTASYAEGYYYKPRIDFEVLKQHKQGLICSAACVLGEVNNLLWCDEYNKAKEIALRYQDLFGEDFYLEIMNHGLDMEIKIMEMIRFLAKDIGAKVIATNDSHFVNKEDHKLQKTLMLLGMHKSWADKDVSGNFFDDEDRSQQREISAGDDKDVDPIFEMPPELYIKNYDEMLAALQPGGGENGVAEQELANTLEIAEKCNCELPIIDPEDLSAYHTPQYAIERDLQYDDYKKSNFQLRQATIDKVVEGVKKVRPDKGDSLDTLLTDHENKSLRFLMWMAEKGLREKVMPKIEAKGEPLEQKYYIKNPPEGFYIDHAHNSPDEIWLKEKFAEGLTEEDIVELYKKQLDYEVSILAMKGFLDYFSIVQQYTNYTKAMGSQVGAGRGSGAGAVLNYLLGITSIDPLPNGLMFERFLNPDRKGYPDIDIDFSKEFRDNVLQPYLRKEYGNDCAAGISTYMYAWGKAAVRAAGRVLFNPPESVRWADELCELIDDKPKLDLRDELEGDEPNQLLLAKIASGKQYRQIIDLALKLQGRVTGESIHASAFILSPFPITDQLPLSVSKAEREKAQKSGTPIENYLIQYDGTVTQDALGFVKLDLLCVKDLEVTAQTLDTIKKIYGAEINIESIPLDDKAVFDMLLEGRARGIFQMDGSPVALRLIQESGANCISDWSAVNALNRPGPLQMGYDKDFITGKKNPSGVKYFTPAAESILKETYGCTCYQESIMLLSQQPTIVGFTPGQSDNLRKIISKKKKDKIEHLKEEAREVARKNGADPKVTEYFLEIAEAAGSYSFNKSHALAYAVVAYRNAFLKAHFPDAFFAAMCTIKDQQKGEDKISQYLEEARQMGITVKPPHVNYSQSSFDVPEKGVIAFGLGGIKRVGKAGDIIIEEREKNGPFVDFTDFCCRVPKTVTKTALTALISAGALDNLGWSRLAMEESIDQIINFRKSWFAEKEKASQFSGSLFGEAGGLFSALQQEQNTSSEPSTYDINLVPPFDTEYTQRQILKKEFEMFGMYFSGSPEDFTQVSRYKCDKEIKERYKRAVKEAKETGSTKPIPLPINICDVPNLLNDTKVEFTASVEDVRMFKSGKGASIFVKDWGKNEESRFGFAPNRYSAKLTCFEKTWVNMPRPLKDDVVHVVGRISIDKEGNFPTSIIVDDLKVIPEDNVANMNLNEMQTYMELQQEMIEERNKYSDPSSDKYMIPAILFKNQVDMESFLYDPDLDRFKGDGRVQISVAGDTKDEFTRICSLKQTRGMVHFAAQYGGIASKIRLPKAQLAMNRAFMMNSKKVSS